MRTGLRFLRVAGFAIAAIAMMIASGAHAASPSVSSISPSSGPLTGGQFVTITGSNLTGATSVTIDGVSLTGITITATQITGTTGSDTALGSPTVSSVSPTYGPTGGGTTVTITGSNFGRTANVVVTTPGGTSTLTNGYVYGAVTAVTIGGTAASPSFFGVTNSTTLTVVTPPGVAGMASVIVQTNGGNSGGSGNNLFAYYAGNPSITSVGPTFGLTTGGNTVTFTGSNFVPGTFASGSGGAPATSFTMGGAAVTNVVCTSTSSCTGTAPARGAGAADVQVQTYQGFFGLGSSDAGYLYLYIAPGTPLVASVSPATGPTTGGTSVLITGSNFTGATSVSFGATLLTATAAGSFQLNSDGSISTTTPAHTAGTVNVYVTVTSGATTFTNTTGATYTYTVPAPIVTSISPNAGSTAGGTSVTIVGQYFTNGQSPSSPAVSAVTIGGTAVTSFTVNSDTQITATTAAHAAGTQLAVVVTTPSGTGTGVAPSGAYTYGTPAPTVTSVSPNSGGVAGLQSVTITGKYFTGVTSVSFGGTSASSFSFVSDTVITATTPAHSAGIVNVAVTTAIGTGIGTDLYSYGASAPTVTGISPNTGTTLGGTAVTITGQNFTGTPQVTIGGVAAAEVTVVNPTTITAVTPAGTGSNVPVIVTTSFGSSTAANIYSYVAPTPPPVAPTVTAVLPNSGTTLGLTPVTISGTNFTGATSVTFGGSAATSVVVNAGGTSITALTPAHAAGVVDVAVTTPAGTGTGTGLYTYVTVAPTVTAVTPNTGTTLGGTAVTITGTNFTGATAVTFGTGAATNVMVLTSTTITATTPAGTGTVSISVTTPNGTGTGANLFTYVAQSPPTVTAISPTSGNTAGGTPVSITGTNFTGATSVTIGGNAATFMAVVNPTTITAVTVAHVAGAVDIVVTTPAGSGTGTKLFTYVQGPPTVTAISPNTGTTLGGTFVTITGTNFTGATSVTIGGNAPTAVTFVSSTSITATTTAHAAGLASVAVTTPAGTGTGTNLFNFITPLSAPVVTSVTASSGPPGGGTVVTIAGSGFTGATAVTFGATPATIFTVNSPTSITATSPVGTGIVNVTVVTPGGTSAISPADQFSYVKATTSLALTSSPNPSVYGQPVTFTAKVTGSSPTGTVTFSEGGKQIGTAPLSNITTTGATATFTISSLPVGADPVTASYAGDANNAADPETLTQYVNAPSDSIKLRELQVAAMPIVANLSSQAISGSVDSAIAAGFSGSCSNIPTPNGSGFTYCFDGNPQAQNGATSASQQARAKVDDDFAALGYASAPAGTPSAAPQNSVVASNFPPYAASRPAYTPPREWLAWIDMRGTDFNRYSVGSDLTGVQVNATAGVTHIFSPTLLAGVLAGYEHFDFTSQAYNGVLTGQGATVGAYLGWRVAPSVRFTAGTAWSDIFAGATSGTATGNFTGHRWLAFGGLTGTYGWAGAVLEPSAQIYTLWEHENAYTDSLGTQQATHDFDTGRASSGLKIAYPFAAGSGTLTPYTGLYADYYFSMDSATAIGLTTVPIIQGWGARATGGLTVSMPGGAQVSTGGEFSGIGNDTHIWTVTVRGSVPF